MSATAPETPPALLPGPSALEVADRSWKADLAFIGMVIAVVVSAAFDFPVRAILIGTLAAPGLVLAVVSARLWIALNRLERREHEAGYTTLFAGGEKLWQLEPRTGVVLRRPGEPRITLAEARRRSGEARQGESPLA